MGDDPRGSTAWRRDPAAYLEARDTTHKIPPAPVSRYLAMEDGVRLAVDVYVPVGPMPDDGFPTILIFTPYYRRFALAADAASDVEACPNAAIFRDMFVPRGYAMVVVDVRGTGASFGTRDSFRSPIERDDYATVMDWVVGQDWSNGRLGATGISYVGAAADFAATTGHAGLQAIAPISAVWDTYIDHYYPGGILLNQLAAAYDHLMRALDSDRRADLTKYPYFADPNLAGPAPVDEDTDGLLVRAAVAEHVANVHMPDFIREFPFRGRALAYDAGFTSDSFSPHSYAAHIRPDVAVFSISGWMDGAYTNGAAARYLSLAPRRRHLLVGPWDHGARVNVSPFRSAVAPSFPVVGAILRFFDTYLCDADTGLAEEAPVHYFTMAEETWKSAPDWPPTGETKVLYLAEGAALSDEPGAAAADDMAVDYGWGTGRNTRYRRLQALAIEDYYGSWATRSDALPHYRTAPLDDDLTVSGHGVVTLHMSSDQADACVFVYLEDEAPDGTARYVSEGMLRALHRAESASPETYRAAWPVRSFTEADAAPLTPGEVAALRFPLLPTSWRFRRGHRIRISLAGADKDNFACLPHGRPGRWKIHRGGAYASAIELPVETG